MTRAGSQPTFRVGAALARGFGGYFRNILPFTAIAALLYSPAIAYSAAFLRRYPEIGPDELLRWVDVRDLSEMALPALVMAFVSLAIFRQRRGERALGASLWAGVRRLLPVLVIAAFTPAAAVGATYFIAPFARPHWFWILFFVAMLPAGVVLSLFWVLIPVLTVERAGIWRALERSFALARGHRLQVFALYLLIAFGVRWAVAPMIDWIARDFVSREWAKLVFAVVWAALYASLVAVTYHDLRIAKDGVPIEELEPVFD